MCHGAKCVDNGSGMWFTIYMTTNAATLTEAIEKVGRQLERTQVAWEDLNGTRRRAVDRTFAEVDELRRGVPHQLSAVELPAVEHLLGERRAG